MEINWRQQSQSVRELYERYGYHTTRYIGETLVGGVVPYVIPPREYIERLLLLRELN
jgi:hypothetical protein